MFVAVAHGRRRQRKPPSTEHREGSRDFPASHGAAGTKFPRPSRFVDVGGGTPCKPTSNFDPRAYGPLCFNPKCGFASSAKWCDVTAAGRESFPSASGGAD